MFLVASQVAWRRVAVQCNGFISRSFAGTLGRGENFRTRIQSIDLSKQRKPIQLRLLHDEDLRVEKKVN